MLAYAFKNLKSLFTKQRLLSLLLVLNIVVSCLVICFSYGLYQNYNMIVEIGEEEKYDSLNILINKENLVAPDDKIKDKAFVDISPAMALDMMRALSANTKSNLQAFFGTFLVESPLAQNNAEASTDGSVEYYSDDAEAFYFVLELACRIEGDKISDANEYDYFTDEQYNNGDKVAVIDKDAYDTRGVIGGYISEWLSWTFRKLPAGTDSIIIGGERYEIIKALPSYDMHQQFISIPLTAIPETSKPLVFASGIEGVGSCFTFFFNEPVTREQYADIQNCLSYLGKDVFLEEIEFTEATEIYYYKTIMLISVVIAVLAAINMAILYRYILEKRSSELAIFRICGCSKGKAIASYLLECTVINAPLFALTQLIYHKLIMPRLTGLFPNMQGAYSLKLYAAIFGIYIGASMLTMLIMIAVTVGKHSLVSLKNSTRATSRFGIMKVFEVVQLAAVLSMMVLIVSAIISRYSLFTPFEPYLAHKGYMVTSADSLMYPEDFEEMIGDAPYIMTEFDSVVDGDMDPYSENHIMLNNISYSDEFVKAYAPPLEDGVWLSDTKDTYESSGYIPAVVTTGEHGYKVGDIIENDIIFYDENNQPYVFAHYKYKIIGVLKDKVNIASFMQSDKPPKDYRAIYNVFSYDYEKREYLLTKISDKFACYKAYGILNGIQFVFCDDMTDEEYEEIGRKLNGRLTAIPLSEVYDNSLDYIYEQMYTLFPIAACIFILTIISTVSISAIYTKRQLRNYAIFYICGARWRTCALKSLKNGAITCAVAAVLSALILIVGKSTLLKETVISFGMWHFAVCAGVIVLYLALSMIMPLSIIGSARPREVLKEE